MARGFSSENDRTSHDQTLKIEKTETSQGQSQKDDKMNLDDSDGSPRSRRDERSLHRGDRSSRRDSASRRRRSRSPRRDERSRSPTNSKKRQPLRSQDQEFQAHDNYRDRWNDRNSRDNYREGSSRGPRRPNNNELSRQDSYQSRGARSRNDVSSRPPTVPQKNNAEPNPGLPKALGAGLKAKPKSFEEATNKALEAGFYVCLPQIRSLAECMLIG